MTSKSRRLHFLVILCLLIAGSSGLGIAQSPQAAKVERGSKTARDGFKNETEIAGKFNDWQTDQDARAWLAAMDYKLTEIKSVSATKPHGEKADVEVRIRTASGEKTEGISIKLVSSPNGFNQIDKRWLATYAKKWRMPVEVVTALKLFVGETPPNKTSRDPKRMYLNEMGAPIQKAVLDFFNHNKDEIISDLFQGDGQYAAGWMMVALKATDKTRWTVRTAADAIRFFGEGKVEITRAGNLKIGRIGMQRKGGDGGRETAKMLQFKINPALLFDAK